MCGALRALGWHIPSPGSCQALCWALPSGAGTVLQLPRVSRTEPGMCWWLPRCFFPRFSERCQSGCEARRERELLPGAAPRPPPPKALPRHLRLSHHQFTAGPRSRRDALEAAAGTAGLDLTALHSWKEPS